METPNRIRSIRELLNIRATDDVAGIPRFSQTPILKQSQIVRASDEIRGLLPISIADLSNYSYLAQNFIKKSIVYQSIDGYLYVKKSDLYVSDYDTSSRTTPLGGEHDVVIDVASLFCEK